MTLDVSAQDRLGRLGDDLQCPAGTRMIRIGAIERCEDTQGVERDQRPTPVLSKPLLIGSRGSIRVTADTHPRRQARDPLAAVKIVVQRAGAQ